MSDRFPPSGRPEEGTPEYDWLYGSRGRSSPSSDDESTQVMPTEPRDTRPRPAGGQPGGSPGAQQGYPGQQPPQPYPGQGRGDQGYPGQGGQGYPGGWQGPPAAPPRQPLAPPPGRGPRRRRPRVKRVIALILALLLLWVAYLVAVPFIALSKVDRVDAFPNGDRPSETDGTTYLVVGSDKADDLTDSQRDDLDTPERSGTRTDTMMLVHVGSGPSVIVSLPRDTLVEIPGHGTGMLNSAFAIGNARLLVKTVEGFTGVRVDHYVEVGFGSIINTVDALGGIEICPKQRFNDPKARLKIKKGCQEVDGMTALAYSRTRATPLADLDRVGRQREVVGALGDKVLSPWTVINPFRYWSFNMAAAESVRADEEIGPLGFARLARGMTGDQLSCTLPNQSSPTDPNRLVVDQERADVLFGAIRDDKSDSIPGKVCTPTGR